MANIKEILNENGDFLPYLIDEILEEKGFELVESNGLHGDASVKIYADYYGIMVGLNMASPWNHDQCEQYLKEQN